MMSEAQWPAAMDAREKGAINPLAAGALRCFHAALTGDGPSIVSLNPTAESVADFAQAVASGLAAPVRRIPSRFLYDSIGSALYEKICTLPEYYLTRIETALLARHARALRARTGPVSLVELGAGSSQKAGLLLEAASHAGDVPRYIAIDVCRLALRRGQMELARTQPRVTAVGVHGRFEQAVALLPAVSPAMVLFLGSTIGNCSGAEATHLFESLFHQLSPGNFCLLGLDLVKDSHLLHAAYNDASGITASFTRNLFARMNRELDAGIDLDAIEHQANWVPERRRIEIHARLLARQTIRVAPLGLSFTLEAGDRILTEVSRKYRLNGIGSWLGRFGFLVDAIYRDEHDWYALVLLRRAAV